jgi:ubiquinone/menaquinone biosynthesis C-methylase UbiE
MLYRARNENADLSAELARLEAQAALSWTAESRRLAGLGLPPRPAIVELGCGPGFVTTRLHELFPGCAIVAVDDDQEMLVLARERCEGLGAIEFVAADAARTGLPDASFDLVFSRYLFQHLSDPAPVASEALRLLRPGGLHVILDIDDELWGIAEPSFPQLQAIHAKASTLQESAGRRRQTGRRLWSILQDAGCVELDVDVFCYGSDWLGVKPFLPQLDPARLLPFVRDGRLPMTDYIAAQFMFETFVANPEARVLLVGFIGWGRRPL